MYKKLKVEKKENFANKRKSFIINIFLKKLEFIQSYIGAISS